LFYLNWVKYIIELPVLYRKDSEQDEDA